MSMRKVIVIGAGGHAAVVAEAALAEGWKILGVLDDDSEKTLPIEGVSHLGGMSSPPAEVHALIESGAHVHAAIGDPEIRKSWLEKFGSATAATIIHPSACLSPSARVEPGVFIGPCAVVNARAQLEIGAIINSGAIVEHDAQVGAYAHLAPGAILAGEAVVEHDAFVGAGAVVLPGVRIGPGATLGAGSVALNDVPGKTTAVGIPAR